VSIIYFNVEDLKQACSRGEKFTYLLFYGHTMLSTDSDMRPCLSQWWPCRFTLGDYKFSSAEQCMMLAKAFLFKDYQSANLILETNDPKRARDLGRNIANFDSVLWDQYKFGYIVQGNYAKFSQNKDLCDYLLSTGNSILVEASPRDAIWGIGMSSSSAFATDPLKWRGQNLLGFAVTKVREMLKADGYVL